jgi:hypothetical protein
MTRRLPGLLSRATEVRVLPGAPELFRDADDATSAVGDARGRQFLAYEGVRYPAAELPTRAEVSVLRVGVPPRGMVRGIRQADPGRVGL